MYISRTIVNIGLVFAISSLFIGVAQASDLSFNLTARVSENCSVTNNAGVASDQGTTFRINTVCNAPNFRLRMTGDLADYQFTRISTVSNASVRLIGNQLLVSQSRPGLVQFDIAYTERLNQAQQAAFIIEGF